jgi:lysyl-tRNA synthetase class 2
VRCFFADRGFLEVETPILSADVVIDRHLDPLSTILFDDAQQPERGRRMWLQTSPEFGMKRLLAAGAKAIYQITRAFRGGEAGRLHNPEFTIVEWYRVGDEMNAGMSLLSELCQTLLKTPPAEWLSYAAAFQQFVGIDPHTASIEELSAAAMQFAVTAPVGLGNNRDDWLNLLLATRVETKLGQLAPTILFDYPASQAALAKIRPGPPAVAERFELYVNGIELANGYHELTDAAELRRRNQESNRQRMVAGKPALPGECQLLAAMEAGLPACTGVALGFDRVVMLVADAKSISEVMAMTVDNA